MIFRRTTAWLAVAAAPFVAPASNAQTVYVVDDDGGPGVDFTALQPAIDVAGPLDRIEVRPGDYGAPLIDHAVTILGGPLVTAAWIEVAGVQGPFPVVLVDFAIDTRVLDCTAPVLVDTTGITQFATRKVTITDSSNVRLAGGTFDACPGWTDQMVIEDSTVFIDNLDIVANPFCYGGGQGIRAFGASVVTISNSSISGQTGYDSGGCLTSTSVDGGPAVFAFGTASVRLLRSTLSGGPGDLWIFGCGDSEMGPAVRLFESATVVSDGTFSAPNVQQISPLPALSIVGPPTPGSVADIRFEAVAGSSARIYLGRLPRLTPAGGSAIPWTNSAERGVSLGSAPASGMYSLPFTIPSLPRGTVIHLQASRTLANGATEFTNPAMLIVR